MWRKYNDEKVTQVRDTNEIFHASTDQRPPTPYFLVYVKDECKEDLVEPLCRDAVEATLQENKDTVMEDYVDIPVQDQIADTYASVQSNAVQVANGEDHHRPLDVGWDDSQAQSGDRW